MLTPSKQAHSFELGATRMHLTSPQPGPVTQSGSTLSPDRPARKLALLDLPSDVLKEIMKHLSHATDLTSVALVHSALHRLAIPYIYSRFDIVWPDSTATDETRGGVDALTYGLTTLNMAEDVFGEADWQRERAARRGATGQQMTERQIRRRRGNYYARYIRKFSIGNGPPEWVEEYLVAKEAGKMLGTLVALALARMKSLETFVWDMPTGIVSDVWTSLSYLGDRPDGEPCRLESVSVRWHNNRFIPAAFLQRRQARDAMVSVDQSKALSRVQYPSFSILPPLKSLSVMDIDELQHLDEMSVLIGASLEKLRELRISIAAHCRRDDWIEAWSGDEFEQIDLSDPIRSTETIGGRRRGGILGVLTSSFLDLKQRDPPPNGVHTLRRRSGAVPLISSGAASSAGSDGHEAQFDLHQPKKRGGPTPKSSHETLETDFGEATDAPKPNDAGTGLTDSPILETRNSIGGLDDAVDLPRRLHLDRLDMERVPLSVRVLSAAIDWSKLASITLIDCKDHEHLWTMLHDEYAKDIQPTNGAVFASARSGRQSVTTRSRLNLKHIHTNMVTTKLLRFINGCLPPNTLESLYLQDHSGMKPSCHINDIFRCIVKRHRSSLQRLLIDSGKYSKTGPGRGSSWLHWAFAGANLRFMVSGKMSALREIGFCILHSQDWHIFSQGLPNLPQLESLLIPRYSMNGQIPRPQPFDVATHLLDVVVFTPTMKLCYMGIYDRCFEIMEGFKDEGSSWHDFEPLRTHSGADNSEDERTADEDDDEDEDHEDDNDTDNDDDNDDDENHDPMNEDNANDRNTGAIMVRSELVSSPISYEYIDSESEDEDQLGLGRRLQIREILFYDDKVEIFKARHGRL